MRELKDAGVTHALIHDAVRPFFDHDLLERVATALADGAVAVLPAIPVADTLKRAESVDPKILREKLRTIDPHAPVTSSMRFDENGEQRYGAISVYRRDKGEWDSVMRSDKW